MGTLSQQTQNVLRTSVIYMNLRPLHVLRTLCVSRVSYVSQPVSSQLMNLQMQAQAQAKPHLEAGEVLYQVGNYHVTKYEVHSSIIC